MARTLADELEDSPLREELFGPKPKVEEAPPVLPQYVYRIEFTGTGSEYFRIWVVNTLLTLVTLGIYSAWAKVRKTRYFWQNARLGGMVFEYHGDPVAILRGRILALVLLVAYSLGFKISALFGLITIALLVAIGPWLLLRAQQFKLRNTSFRGLRFGFDGKAREAYVRFLPLLVVWFASTIVSLAVDDASGMTLALLSFLTLALFPLMHHELKSFQHANATYGDRRFSFGPVRDDFYVTYLKGLGILIPVGIAGGMGASFVAMMLAKDSGDDFSTSYALAVGIFIGALVYIAVGPYLAARLQRVVWDHTSLPGMRFRTEIKAWPLFKIVLKNWLLILLTFGFYWPFASVALARYRTEVFVLESEIPLDSIADATHSAPETAAGEGAADLFGLDIGL